MAPLFGVWRPTKSKLLRRVHDRLSDTGGCLDVWYEPSRLDPNEVVARVEPTVFLGREYSSSDARLRVEFDVSGGRPKYWVQWWEPEADRGFGWHADDTEPEYGPVHLQVEYPDGTTDRRAADYSDGEHPYRTFERLLGSIDGTLTSLEWE